MNRGKLYLIPSPLGDNNPEEVLPSSIFSVIGQLNHFVVEEVRSARRFLSRSGLKGKIEGLNFYPLNEHTKYETIEGYIKPLLEGNDMGLISEAGLPAVADPGAQLVLLAHRYDIKVVPLVGPSSLMMALMSSGLNGQCFAFTGYLPVKIEERRAKLKLIENVSKQLKQTQIIIETPYRNEQLFADMLQVLSPKTKVTVAADITLESQTIVTKEVLKWRKENFVIGKRPAVFLILA